MTAEARLFEMLTGEEYMQYIANKKLEIHPCCKTPSHVLVWAFSWHKTPEGWAYWNEIHRLLKEEQELKQ